MVTQNKAFRFEKCYQNWINQLKLALNGRLWIPLFGLDLYIDKVYNLTWYLKITFTILKIYPRYLLNNFTKQVQLLNVKLTKLTEKRSSWHSYMRKGVHTLRTLKFPVNAVPNVGSHDKLWYQKLAVHVLNGKLKLSNIECFWYSPQVHVGLG